MLTPDPRPHAHPHQAARLELERIFITLESELSSNSALVPELLPAVEQYGSMEGSLISMVQVTPRGCM